MTPQLNRLPLACLLALTAAPALAAPVVTPARVPATGAASTTVQLDAFGRYRLAVRSEQGVALEVIDRMAGSLGTSGQAGEQDGALDLFLERGEVLVRTRAHMAGEGSATVEALPFTELTTTPVRLPETPMLETRLGDLEQRSWWVELGEDDRLVVEAAGRSLADVRLWADGEWLVDAEPSCDIAEAVPGQPVRRCGLVEQPGAGLYLITAYGGEPLPWTEAGAEDVLYVRRGVPVLGAPGAHSLTISPFGRDRYRVSAGVDLLRAELPDAASFVLAAEPWNEAQPLGTGSRRDTLTTESRTPAATVRMSRRDSGEHLVVLSGSAGQSLWLQTLATTRQQQSLSTMGPTWLTVQQAGHAVDSADITGILVRSRGGRTEVIDESTLPLAADKGYKRRFNMLGPNQLYFRVEETGTFLVRIDEIDGAKFRMEPFTTSRPRDYKSPDWQYGTGRVTLDPGLYVLSLVPANEHLGIATVEVMPEASTTGRMLDAVGMGTEVQLAARRYTLQPGLVNTAEGYSHAMWVAPRHGVDVGVVQRPGLPSLAQPLPLSLAPGQLLDLTVEAPEAGRLRISDERGQALSVSVDGGRTWSPSPSVSAGQLQVQVRHPQALPTQTSLALVAPRRDPKGALPAMPDATLAGVPQLDELRSVRTADLDAGRDHTWRLIADEPGLYRLESTGLLETAGAIRTRTRTSLASAAANGIGRNFLLQRYLREGDYQLTVSTRGRSAGHLGVQLVKTELLDGGVLTDGVAARAQLWGGQGIVYTFTVTERGAYRLRTLGQGKTFSCRLEDADGWPIGQPGRTADLTEVLDPGDYRLVLLPDDLPSTRITTLEAVRGPTLADGHGPHALSLDHPQQHIWWESPEQEERTPDTWTFSLPADVGVTITATEEMAGELHDAAGEQVARLTPGRALQQELAAGDYTLRLVNARRNNGVTYQVKVRPDVLVAGMRRSVRAPTTVPLQVGDDGLIELATFGQTDVRAWLSDADGRVLAVSDDRPDDWNIQLFERLDPGRYQLRIEPVGTYRAQVQLEMQAPTQLALDPLVVPASRELSVAGQVAIVPLELPKDPGVLAVSLRSAEVHGASVEVQQDGRWRELGSATGRDLALAVRPAPDAPHRLRVWSLDQRGNPASLTVDAKRAARVGEAGLSRGAALRPAAEMSPTVSSVVANLDRPGLFRVTDAPEGLQWCPEPGSDCVEVEDGLIATGERELWLAAPMPDGRSRARVTLERVSIATGEEQALPLATDAPVMVDLVRGGDGPTLAWVDAAEGQPGLVLSERGRRPETGTDGVAITPGGAVAVRMAGRSPAAVVWRATPGATAGLRARLSQVSFAMAELERTQEGWSDGEVPPLRARRLLLPRGATVHGELDLEAGLVAVHAEGNEVQAVHAGGRLGAHAQITGEAKELWLLNPTDEPRRYSLLLLPGQHAPAAVSVGRPFERRLSRPGTVQVAVAPGEGRRTLHVRGAEDALFTEPDGRTQRGRDLELGPQGGLLQLTAGRGLLLAWASSLMEADGGPFGEVARPPSAQALAAPIRAPLDQELERFSLAEGAGLLHLSVSDTAIVRIDASKPLTEVLDGGGVLDAWVPEGAVEVWLRGPAGTVLGGELQASWISAEPLAEGLNPAILLGPGDTRPFSFTLDEPTAIGLGVRGARDVVEARLYGPSGEVLDAGVVMMRELPPGTYVLALHLPPDAHAPVRAQPALVGAERPPTTPPEDVIRSYLDLAAE